MAENENMTEDKGAEGQPAAKKKGSKLIIILIVGFMAGVYSYSGV